MDPDFAGRKGRSILESTFPGQLWHAFIPAGLATSSQKTRQALLILWLPCAILMAKQYTVGQGSSPGTESLILLFQQEYEHAHKFEELVSIDKLSQTSLSISALRRKLRYVWRIFWAAYMSFWILPTNKRSAKLDQEPGNNLNYLSEIWNRKDIEFKACISMCRWHEAGNIGVEHASPTTIRCSILLCSSLACYPDLDLRSFFSLETFIDSPASRLALCNSMCPCLKVWQAK